MKLIVIGTDSNCQVKLHSQFVSGYHAEILLLDNGEILLTDKGSRNGTYLNDQRLQPNRDIPIKRGDNIRFADQILDWQNVPTIVIDSDIKEMRGIGTNFRNKYQLQGEKVSRYHATLSKRKDKKWYIQDHSKNGTTINGKAIPSNQNIRLKRGDKILCAGVPVPNPCKDESSVNLKPILLGLLSVLILVGCVFFVPNLIRSCGDDPKPVPLKPMTDKEIYDKYKNSVVLLVGCYYYKVSAGNLNLTDYELPTEVAFSNGKIKPLNEQRSNMNIYTGTGFYVSEDGKIVTNLHIVRPWLFKKEQSLISDQYKMYMSIKALENPVLNAFIDQIKVEGVLSYISMIPNGAYYCEENHKRCRELIAHDNKEKDVAVLQLETMKLPDDKCTIVNLDEAVTDDSVICVGSHVYTMGFPFGLNLQNLKSSKGIQLLGHGGSVIQECSDYSFRFDASSYYGASGSPIFNEKGQLIGVLTGGASDTQGFNYAIKASHVIDLLDTTSETKKSVR